jgi:hypothetical protein
MITKIALGMTGVYMTIFPLAANTKNFKSALFFKIIPFMCGLACDFAFLMQMGYIVKM